MNPLTVAHAVLVVVTGTVCAVLLPIALAIPALEAPTRKALNR